LESYGPTGQRFSSMSPEHSRRDVPSRFAFHQRVARMHGVEPPLAPFPSVPRENGPSSPCCPQSQQKATEAAEVLLTEGSGRESRDVLRVPAPATAQRLTDNCSRMAACVQRGAGSVNGILRPVRGRGWLSAPPHEVAQAPIIGSCSGTHRRIRPSTEAGIAADEVLLIQSATHFQTIFSTCAALLVCVSSTWTEAPVTFEPDCWEAVGLGQIMGPCSKWYTCREHAVAGGNFVEFSAVSSPELQFAPRSTGSRSTP
jgi:hypothetical protein